MAWLFVPESEGLNGEPPACGGPHRRVGARIERRKNVYWADTWDEEDMQ